jgi:hypothetical protein
MPALSPFTQEILRFAWDKLFEEGPYFLPDLLKPHVEPLKYAGPSPAVSVQATEDACDAACIQQDVESGPNPIASSLPSLSVMNARVGGLSAVRSGGALTFSDKQPEFTARMNVGKLRGKDVPIVVDASGDANYAFAIGCCIPVSDSSRTCTAKKWTATAHGKFKATVREASMTARIRAEFSDDDVATITVADMKLTADQSKIDIEFDVADLDDAFIALADQAVQTGIATGAVETTLQNVVNSAGVKAEISRILTRAVNDLAVRGA